MRSRLPAKSGLPPLTLAVLGFFVLLIGAVGTVGLLAFFGVVNLSALLSHHRARRDTREGMVAIPVSSRFIATHSRVEREDLADYVHSLPVLYIYRKPADVGKTWITDYSEIVGRVMARDKKAGLVFSESDFMPRGTRPGLVSGIPVGKRGMVLDANQIRGLDELRVGDHFDLLSSEPVDLQGLQPEVRAGSSSRSLIKSMGSASGIGQSARVIVLVENGVLVTRPAKPGQAAAPRSNSAANQLTGAGAASRKNQPLEMAIAVAPEEITPLTEALTAKKSIFCVARSGLPDEKFDRTTIPAADPLKKVSVIEVMHGKKSALEAFAASDGSPLARVPLDKPLPPADTPTTTSLASGKSAPLGPKIRAAKARNAPSP